MWSTPPLNLYSNSIYSSDMTIHLSTNEKIIKPLGAEKDFFASIGLFIGSQYDIY
jgi:hypothetical protein